MNKTYLLPWWFRRFFGLSGQGYEGTSGGIKWGYRSITSATRLLRDSRPQTSRVRYNEVIQKYADFKGAVPVRRVYDCRYLCVTSSPSVRVRRQRYRRPFLLQSIRPSYVRYSTAYWDILHSFDFVSGINSNEIVFQDRRKLTINIPDKVGS